MINKKWLSCGGCLVLGGVGLTLILGLALVATRGHPGWLVARTLRAVGLVSQEGLPNRPGYGVFGTIVRVDGHRIIVNGRSNDEITVIVDDNTLVEQVARGKNAPEHQRISLSEVIPGEGLIAFGRPDEQGHTVARLIRIYSADNWPPPPLRQFP